MASHFSILSSRAKNQPQRPGDFPLFMMIGLRRRRPFASCSFVS